MRRVDHERDIIITKCVLRGWTSKYTGIYFKLTASYINCIVKKVVRNLDKDLYDWAMGSGKPLEKFREKKDHILSKIF